MKQAKKIVKLRNMFEYIVSQLPEHIFLEFRKALESGYWSSGMKLTEIQKKICLESMSVQQLMQTKH